MAEPASLGQTNIQANSIKLNDSSTTIYRLGESSSNTISMPTSNTTAKTKTGSLQNAGQVISGIASSANGLVGAYGNLTSAVKNLTGISLPDVSSVPVIGNVLTGLNTLTNVATTLTTGQNGTRVQADNTNPQTGAFKWVERETEPGDFVSYDSVLLFVGEPIYADNAKGTVFTPLGLCEQFTVSTSVQVTSIQELRCEEQIILPGKTQPVMISISRFCGKWSNLLNRLHGVNTDLTWNMSTQYPGMRKLFGLYCIVMDTSRRNVIHSFYVERCAIEQISFGITAGQMQVIESCSIKAGRIIDPNYVIPAITTSSGTGTTTDSLKENTNSEETEKKVNTINDSNLADGIIEKVDSVGTIKRDSDTIFYDTNDYYISAEGIKKEVKGSTAVERMESLSGKITYAENDGTNCARAVSLAYGGDLANINNCDSLLNAAIKSSNFDVVQSNGTSIKTGENVDITKSGTLVMWNNEDNTVSNVHVVMVKDANTTLNCGASHGTVGVDKKSATVLAGSNPINCYIIPK